MRSPTSEPAPSHDSIRSLEPAFRQSDEFARPTWALTVPCATSRLTLRVLVFTRSSRLSGALALLDEVPGFVPCVLRADDVSLFGRTWPGADRKLAPGLVLPMPPGP